jgi:predicted DCC family thiol-disulfide oxidoreductase YuxK
VGEQLILFDGVCNLCNKAVQIVLKNDPEKHFRFASLQSETGKKILEHHHLQADNPESFLLVEEGKVSQRSTAALKVARKLKGGWKLLYPLILIPAFIRDPVYNFIARNRYKWFGKNDVCWLPKPEYAERFIN